MTKKTKAIVKKIQNVSEESSNLKFEFDKLSVFLIIGLIATLGLSTGYFYSKTKSFESISLNTTQTQPEASANNNVQQAVQPQISQETIKAIFAKNVIKFGNGDKKLLMIEVSDPSCPYCSIAAGINTEIGAQAGAQFKLVSQGGTYVAPVIEMKKLVDQGKADFAWIYTNGHGNGELATKSLYCAFDQGKFWQAHDLLMSAKGYDLINNQIKNDVNKSQQMADFLAKAVDKNKLKSCLDSGKYNSRLQEDSSLATSLGINGTPGFYLNTTNFAGAYSWTDMKSVAEAALQK